jgi:hypothetical protein
MAYTLQNIEQQIRYTRFRWDGKENNLHDVEGYDAMPETLLKQLINEAGIEINMELKADLEIKHNSMTEDSDVVAMPTNMLALKKFVRFDDANTAGSSTAVSSYASTQGTPLTLISSYDRLIANRSDSEVSGIPTRFMLHEQGGVLYAVMDKKADAAYFYDLYFWAIPATMTVDANPPDIPVQYQSLYRLMGCKKVAEFLGDQAAEQKFLVGYKEKLQQMVAINNKRHTPSRVAFRTMP